MATTTPMDVTGMASGPASDSGTALASTADGSAETSLRGSLPLAELLNTLARMIGSTIDAKFRELKEKVRQEQVLSAERMSKWARTERLHALCFKGNEDQYFFNKKVMDALDEMMTELKKAAAKPVVATLDSLRSTLEKAMEAAKEGEGLLKLRQKHIKLADRSDHWWKVVQKYETDDLVNDSGDEKRIAKAEKAAEAKAVTSKKKGPAILKSQLQPHGPDWAYIASELLVGSHIMAKA